MAGEDIERRLAAIMSADVAGYSRLMGKDETGTLAALKALRKDVFAPERVLELEPGFTISGLCAAFAIHESLAAPLSEALNAAGLPA